MSNCICIILGFLIVVQDPQAGARPRQVVTVTPDDTLETVLGLIVLNRIHRVYIVESKTSMYVPKPQIKPFANSL